jgi:hypothetical protein
MWSSEKKGEFRWTEKWRKFRAERIAEQKIDPVTKSKLVKSANLHHMDPLHYDDLDPRKFVVLNPETHKIVEALWRKKDWRGALESLKKILETMELIRSGSWPVSEPAETQC